MRKFIFIIALCCSVAFAGQYKPYIFQCPTVDEIKNNNYIPWLPLYADIEELASDEDVNNFKLHITAFSKAEWDPRYLESGHCLYQRDDSENNIVLATDAWGPVESTHWQWLQKNLASCVSTEVGECRFIY